MGRERSFRPWNQRGYFNMARRILTIERAFPVPSQGPEPDILFRLVVLPVPVVVPAPLGGADMDPARCPVDRAGISRGLYESLDEHGRGVVALGPVVGQAPADDGEDVRAEIGYLDPGQDEEPRIVDHQREVLLAQLRRPSDEPVARGRSYAEINAWLMDRCIEDAKKRPHPTIEGKTVWQVFEEERPFLMAYRGPFDGFYATEVAVSKTCLVRFDNNHYSVAARAVGRPVDVRAYADRFVIRQDGETVAEHPRSFGRGEIAYDPWHYVPILTRKPGALRNGAPFKGWQLPGALGRIRARLTGCDDGDRQFVRILAAVQEDGLEAVEAACAEALDCGACSADVVLNILARQCQPAPPATIPTPEGLQLRHRPVADCQRYDRLREAGHGAS